MVPNELKIYKITSSGRNAQGQVEMITKLYQKRAPTQAVAKTVQRFRVNEIRHCHQRVTEKVEDICRDE